MSNTMGYAVIDHSGVLINTVAATERGAKVNWLYTAARVPLTNAHSDDQISELFETFSKRMGSHVAKVSISAAD